MDGVPADWLVVDYYAELGVGRQASAEELRAAYRSLAQRLHPDRHPDDASTSARFAMVAAAYQILSNPASRAAYDQLRAPGPRVIPVAPRPAHRVPSAWSQPPRSDPRWNGDARGTGSSGRERPDEPAVLTWLLIAIAVGVVLLIVAIVVAVFVIGPQCNPARELVELGCPPISPGA